MKEKKLKVELEGTILERLKGRLNEEYKQKNKGVKTSAKEDKRKWYNMMTEDAEKAAENGRSKGLYNITKILTEEDIYLAEIIIHEIDLGECTVAEVKRAPKKTQNGNSAGIIKAISATNGSQSPCTATATNRPTAEESLWMRALDRHHANLQNNEQTCPVADDAEGTERNATSPGPSISASSQSKKIFKFMQHTTDTHQEEDLYTLQCAFLEKELEKNTLQVDLLRKLLSKYDSLDSDALELLSVLGQ
ncbi:unnamed protein product [Mytilus edulis]|uniref:Uncharacterized protein n=1 Tax=Mytilus edulis TaxID=6550 RepID=A0A8S3VS24_MYTED|nr:unnamed protein product [Mytilus edulis]